MSIFREISIALALLLTMSLMAGPGYAALVTEIAFVTNTTMPVGNNPSGLGGYGISVLIENPYDATELHRVDIGTAFVDHIADSIISINPDADRNAIVDNCIDTLTISTPSEVETGWNTLTNLDGSIAKMHGPFYESFLSGSAYANQNSTAINFWGDLQHLDTDGFDGYNRLTDACLNIDEDNQHVNVVIGTSTDGELYGGHRHHRSCS